MSWVSWVNQDNATETLHRIKNRSIPIKRGTQRIQPSTKNQALAQTRILALLFLMRACGEARGSHQQRRANPERRLYTNSLAVSRCPAIAVSLLTAVPSKAFAAATGAAAAGWLGLVVVQQRLPVTPALLPAAAKAKSGERAVAKRADLPCVRVSVRETESARWAQQ
jgi:hypothetical protein